MARLGCEVPRVWTPPLRELTPDTTLGYDVCEFAESYLGLDLLPWQKWLFIHGLEIVGEFGKEWQLRYRVVLVLVARQSGKSLMGMVLALFFIYVLGARLVLGTAQDLDQATEVWEGAVEMAQENDELAAEIEKIYRGNGNKTLTLENRRRYKVAAATRKGTRGKTSNLVLMDEIREHQNFQAWSAASKTTKAVRSALVWCMSNAGDGSSVVLRHLRMQAHRAIGDPDGIVAAFGDAQAIPDQTDEERQAMEDALSSIAIFEWSAPPDCDIWDRDAWAQANPSMGYGFLDESTIASDCATDPEQDFRVEDLCQWITASITPPFPVGAWEAGIDPASEIAGDDIVFGVDMAEDRSRCAIAVCGKRRDGDWHVEVAEYRNGIGWLVTWFQNAAPKYGRMRVAMQVKGSPIASMCELLGAIEGVEVVPCQGPDVAGWCGRLWDAVAACDPDPDRDHEGDMVPVRHRPQPALDLAANVAKTRPMGDGAWAWDRRGSTEDISPLVACTVALGASMSTLESRQAASAYETRGVRMV